MAHQIPARLSPAEGRKFGVQVGAAFLVIAAILWWRGRGAAPWIGGLGGLLVLLGILVPAQLGPIYRAWMGLALLLSKVTTPIFMGVVYFGVLTPIGLLMRAFGKNPLRHKGMAGGSWVARPSGPEHRSSMERQF